MVKVVKSIFATTLVLGLLCYSLIIVSNDGGTRSTIVLPQNVISVPQEFPLSSLSLSCDRLISASSPKKECECIPRTRSNSASLNPELNNKCSMCSDEATTLGSGQQVISYTFYKSKYPTRGNKDNRTNYYGGINRNLNAMREVYPGWVMRVYSNLTFTPGDETCNLICANQEDLYWCDVNRIRNPGNPSVSAKHLHGWFWRFFLMIDPLVSIFLSRDLDSVLGMRDRKAVKEWEEREDKAIHLMRDHAGGHRFTVMAGMWGMKNDDGLMSPEKRKEMLMKLIKLEPIQHPEVDQYALNKVLYTEDYFPLILAHDSFHCKVFNKTECIPFPDGGFQESSYVGKVVLIDKSESK